MRILGIDYGSSKIGLALGETDVRLATPFGVLVVHDGLLDDVITLIAREGVELIVVGIPYNEKMEDSKQARQVRQFIAKLTEVTKIPVVTVDERFSTVQAKRLMLDDTMKGEDDAIAAMVILQAYMDQKTVE